MATSSSDGEIFVTSRSRTPSLIYVNSQYESIFRQLPDLIQEAAVSTEFNSPNLCISRVQHPPHNNPEFMTSPIFSVTSRPDSAIVMPDFSITDERFLDKYGSDLTANFADIRAYGTKAFFRKENISTKSTYALCACATGYIWVNVVPLYLSTGINGISELEIQIGTFALKARSITTREILCSCEGPYEDDWRGELAISFSNVLARYLQLRIMGQQYEYALETAISMCRRDRSHWKVLDPCTYDNGFESLLKSICENAPMPPTSDVSLISRSMITARWECWRDKSVLRKRYFMPKRVLRCFRTSRHDSIDLLSNCFRASTRHEPRLPS